MEHLHQIARERIAICVLINTPYKTGKGVCWYLRYLCLAGCLCCLEPEVFLVRFTTMPQPRNGGLDGVILWRRRNPSNRVRGECIAVALGEGALPLAFLSDIFQYKK